MVVDDRERGSGVFAALQKIEGVRVSMRRLRTGDYAWGDRLLFERKTLSDLVASIRDGRLLGQACRLASAPHAAIMILEGTGPFSSGMNRKAIQGALITITVRLGIPLLRSMGPEETAFLMWRSARQIRSISARPITRSRKGKRPTGKRKIQLEILQGLPRVGPHRARRLLRSFGSVRAVTSASLDELSRVPGIGKGTAGAIRWAVC